MSNEFRPHPYQSYCIKRIEAEPYAGLFLDMGLGKTVITLTAINELRYFMFRVRRVLIIAPKMVAQATWTAEQAKWPHLSRLRLSVVLGSRQERVAALRREADVYVINRDNVVWLCEYYGHAWPFDMVVLDESSSFKNPQAKRFKALRAMRPRISRLVLLTGTPAPKSLADLWAQIYLLDGGKRLGRTLGAYRDAFFVPGRRNQTVIFEYLPKEGAEEQIYNLIDDICVSMKSEDYLQLPDYTMARTVNNEGLEDYSRFDLGDRALNNMDRDYERTHYHVNAAALLRMGKWFEWMQEQGVWDNTRIIIVADHGRNLSLYDEWKIDDVFRLEMVTPLLMVKDFNATGFTTSNEFMTNADVPALALEGVVDNPVNPFTGQPITTDAKNEEEMLVTASANWRTGDNDGYTFNTSDAPWYSVHDDIYDRDNWTRYETYEEAAREVSR